MSMYARERRGERKEGRRPDGRAHVFAVLVGALVFVFSSGLAAQSTRRAPQVLVLQSMDRGSLVFDTITAEFRAALQRRAGSPVSLFDFVVVPAGLIEAPQKPIRDFLHSVYGDRHPPELLVTIGGPAAAYVRSNRADLFPQTPVLFAGVEERFLRDPPLGENESSVTVSIDYTALIDDILQLLPETRSVFMLTGSGPLSTFWRAELQRNFEIYGDRLTFMWSDDLSYEQMMQRAATLPIHSVIFYITAGTFATGSWRGDELTLADLSARANAPVFGAQSVWLGAGTVGGRLLDLNSLGDFAAAAAVRILNGEPPRDIRLPSRSIGPPVFDARQLRRWNISETLLPPGSDVKFRGPSLWRDYRREMLAVSAALVAQAVLIAGLLYQRGARRRAEAGSRRNLALAADADRRVTMSALSGSIAHDLSQPLSAILHNAQAGEMMVTSNRATPETLKEILVDIRRADVRATEIIERHRTMLRSREIETKPIDFHTVVRESLALVANDTTKRDIRVDDDLPPGPCIVIGDPILLQQVVVNLIMNAMDAMADTPVDRRRITVSEVVEQGRVKLSVRDEGMGLPAGLNGNLFQPFVTTKATGLGLGLTIVHTIVEAHEGTIDASDNPTGGATFTVTLPYNEALSAV